MNEARLDRCSGARGPSVITWFFCALATALCLLAAPANAASRRQSADEWRKLTATNAPLPRIFVRKDEIRFYFGSDSGPVGFVASLAKERLPTSGYRVSSALLRFKRKLKPIVPDGWKEPVLVTGAEWRRLSTNLLAGLTPASPGLGRYYRGLLGDRLLYRGSKGEVASAQISQPPPGVVIDHRYSIEESLQMMAGLAEPLLLRDYPNASLFVVLVHPARSPQPLLIDVAHHRCVWLSTAALFETEEPMFGLAPTFNGISALVFESNGLALLKNPVSSIARLGNFLFVTGRGLAWIPVRKPTGPFPPLTHAPGMDLPQWESWLDRHTGQPREYGSIRLLIDGERFFPRFEQAVTNATAGVRVHVFIFDNDDVAVEIADLLKKRSSDVPVEVILDRLASMGAARIPPATPPTKSYVPPTSILSYLRHDSHVQVRPFLNAFCSYDHSKIYLADKRGWMGGMNVGREYRSEWHDMMVELEGPVVSSLEYQNQLDWAHAGLWGDLGYLAALISNPKPSHVPPAAGSWIQMRLLPTTTTRKPFSKAVFHAIKRARNYIYAENPYLFDKQIMSDLVRARQRGVDVRVILPHVNDSRTGARAELVAADYLVRQGVRVFFYPGMTHVKALLVDDWACVGSGNLNQLSLLLCQEHNVATSDPVFAARLKHELFEEDFTHCYELNEPVPVEWMDFLASFALEGI
ncbi:MAG TPA: phosphatidylserine/phosphatidylglycerophosphate/cardiolipin synthase family protein [Verrucomicrobiae bacterium]|nr:phosphatidylserine/phosphatidylglycerophosphate/cardiolipin synthase family protein [Verrucomicrobiae bacterium]